MNKPTIGHYASHQRDVTAQEDAALNAALRSSTIKVEHPEIARLRDELAKADGQINRCVDQNKYLESTIERLREYARHTPGCRWQWSLDRVCDCGYDELMAEVGESK